MQTAAFALCIPRACTAKEPQAACSRRHALKFALAAAVTHIAPLPVAARGLSAGSAAASVPTTFPDDFPYTAADFARYDEDDDAKYYAQPRRVTHIDDRCVAALRDFCSERIASGDRVLDLCAGYASYLPDGVRAAGVGMNQREMAANTALESVIVQDLNKTSGAALPFEDASFDAVLCALSIDYLTHPVRVLKEASRVLRPGGRLLVAFSDRVFAEKAVANWTAGSDDDHIYTVSTYIHFAGGFGAPSALDISPRSRGGALLGDPLYIVEAERLSR